MQKAKQKRGVLTNRIKHASMELLGYEITTEELRLLPYIQYVVVNWNDLDCNRINRLEQGYIDAWEENGYITTKNRFNPKTYKLFVTKEFWDIICQLIYYGYVNLEKN